MGRKGSKASLGKAERQLCAKVCSRINHICDWTPATHIWLSVFSSCTGLNLRLAGYYGRVCHEESY
jgi:hypothetical protein